MLCFESKFPCPRCTYIASLQNGKFMLLRHLSESTHANNLNFLTFAFLEALYIYYSEPYLNDWAIWSKKGKKRDKIKC